MKIEFEFNIPEGVVPAEGVAVLHCYDPSEAHEGGSMVFYGNFGDPSTLTAVGMYHVGLRDAESQFAEGEEDEG